MFKNLDGEKILVWFLGIVLSLIVLMILSWIGLATYAAHDLKPYMKVESTDDIAVYSIWLDRKWGVDRKLYVTTNSKEAKEFYLELYSKY